MSPPYETINPWAWQDQFGFSQAVATSTPSRWLFLAGQGPAAADGSIVAPGDIGGQLTQALDNSRATSAHSRSANTLSPAATRADKCHTGPRRSLHWTFG